MRFEIASQGIGVLLSDFTATIVDNTGYPIPIESQPLQLTAVGKRSALITESTLTVCNTAGNRVIEERMEGKNAIAVSALADTACIIIAEGLDVDADAAEKAAEQGISVLRTPLPIFEAAKRIDKALT